MHISSCWYGISPGYDSREISHSMCNAFLSHRKETVSDWLQYNMWSNMWSDTSHANPKVLLSKFPFRFYLSAVPCVLDSVCENQKRDFEWWHKCRGNWGLFDDHLICSTTWETTSVCFRLYSQAYQFIEHFVATWLRFIWF